MMDRICQTFMARLRSDEQKIFPLTHEVSSAKTKLVEMQQQFLATGNHSCEALEVGIN